MALTHASLLQQWRDRASRGQAAARRVLAEMLTPSGGHFSNCYKFISLVTGCSLSTIGSVNEQMRTTSGEREPPEHGLKRYFKENPHKRRIKTTSSNTNGQWLIPPLHRAATFVPPLCNHKTLQVAQRRQKGCLGRSRVAQRTFRPRHGRHGRREVFSMFKTVAQRSPRRSVAHRSFKGGRRKAQASPWSQNGCTGVGHWSPCKTMHLLQTLYINLSDASASLVPLLCLLWLTNSVHWAITVATTVPPFGDHGTPWAIMAMVLPPLCLLCTTCCATTAVLVVKEHTRVVLQQLHRNTAFWVWVTTEHPGQFSGRSKVARRSQPCVKGA